MHTITLFYFDFSSFKMPLLLFFYNQFSSNKFEMNIPIEQGTFIVKTIEINGYENQNQVSHFFIDRFAYEHDEPL